MNTGSILMGRPSLGSWVSYGLGTENQNMPAFVVMPDPGGGAKGGPPAWGSGYLPSTYQGTTMRPGKTPILHLAPPAGMSTDDGRAVLSFLNDENARHRDARDGDDELSARLAAYELAYRMQAEAPSLVDISQDAAEYELLVVPGGHSPEKLRLREEAVDIARTFMDEDRRVPLVAQ